MNLITSKIAEAQGILEAASHAEQIGRYQDGFDCLVRAEKMLIEVRYLMQNRSLLPIGEK